MKRSIILTICLILLFFALAAWQMLPTGNHAPAVSAQTPANIRMLTLVVNDLVYDPYAKLIYASVPSSVGANGNSIAFIDPVTGAIGPYIFIGSEPNRLALSDNGKYLYVGLEGVAGIRRLNLATRTPEATFSLGTGSFGPLFPEDIEVRPGCPDEVAVSLRRPSVSPRHGGVALYVNGVRRPNLTQEHTGSNVIEFCSSTVWLYGVNNETTEFGFRRISVGDTGLREVDVVRDFFSGFGGDFRCDGGVGYTNNGRAFDPRAKMLLGSFNASGLVRPDQTVNRVFYLTGGGSGGTTTLQVRAFDITTFLPLGSVDVPNVSGSAGSLIRWGVDGLAFRTFGQFGQSGGGQIFLVRAPLVSGLGSGPVTVSSASFNAGRAAPESIASLFGTGLAAGTATAMTTPLPTQLGGVSIKVTDSQGTERLAPLFFVSPTQINYQIPIGTLRGNATVTIEGAATIAGTVNIGLVVPGLYTANATGLGPAAAVAIRVKADNTQTLEPVVQFNQAQNRFETLPLDLGPETDRVFLVLFGTGLRNRTDPAQIIARIGCADAQVIFADAQGDLVGLDQVNLLVPRTLIGRGEIDVALTLDGQTTNFVKVNIR